MNVAEIGYRTSSALITTSWAAVVRTVRGTEYRAVGCQPDPDDPSMPLVRTVPGGSPAKAYQNLVEVTGRPWCVVMREGDIIELAPREWRDLVRSTVRIRMVSEVLWKRAELIWEGALDDIERSRALWLALTAACVEEITVMRDF